MFSNNRIGSTVKWKINPTTSFTIKPVLSFTDNSSTEQITTTENNNKNGLLNISDNSKNTITNGTRFSNDINFRKQFKKGKILSFLNTIIVNSNSEKTYSLVKTKFFTGSVSDDSLNQLRINTNPTTAVNFSGRYSQPLSKTIQFSLTHSFNYTEYNNKINSFHKGLGYNYFNILVDSLSNNLNRKIFSNSTLLSFDFRIHNAGLSLNMTIKDLDIQGITKANNLKQKKIYFLPGLNFRWNGIFMSYATVVNEPRTSLLLPIQDNTNPVFIQLGNLNLLPTTTQSYYLTYDKYDAKKMISYRALFNSFYEQNGVITQRSISARGIQTYEPVNSSGLLRFRTSSTITKDFKLLNQSQLSIGCTLYADYNKTFLIINSEKGWQKSWNINPSIRYSYNWNDKIDIGQEFMFSYSTSKYENNTFHTINFFTKILNTDFTFRPTKVLTLETSVNYYNSSIENSQQKNTVLWNAALHRSFLKNNKADLKLSVYNLLGESRNITRIIAENYISDININNINRYLLLTLTYNLRDFENHKSKKERLLFF
jgi:hypothetical protein